MTGNPFTSKCLHPLILVRLCILAYLYCNRLRIYPHTVPDGLMTKSHIGDMGTILGEPTCVLHLSQTGVKLNYLQWSWWCIPQYFYTSATPWHRYQ